MKVIITGAGGFLGSHTVKHLQQKGHEVTAFTQDVRQNLPAEKFDCLYHFAAYVGGRKGIDNNKWRILENIEIDRITFQWAEQWCNKIIYPSSCAGYPLSLQQVPENHMHEEQFGHAQTFDVYGLTKIVAENMLKELDIPAHAMRLFSVYGPGQTIDYPLPSIINRAKQGQCSVWGSGKQTRDWVYIDDALEVFEHLLYRDDPLTVNVATGKATTFVQLAETVFNVLHGKTVSVQTHADQPEGASHRLGSTQRLESIGLSCSTSIETGIRKMLNC